MATPTQAPTKVPQEPDPFYYGVGRIPETGVWGDHRAACLLRWFRQVTVVDRTGEEAVKGDYDTVQTVGMTLATILFLLGILIIISKKVKCRKADSSPTCKSCKSELPSSAPGGGGV
ncbi:FXYD domain-containing ion transport regulator 7 isoform X2 [Canis lupus baileyi]|uniref:FXYD domain-containing ion transport regulator 7 isoform X2 n=1 Tax=Canis lupus dingo TaxID=286419 RepID=UPI0015F15CB2|nr:FXYD domain-containing ion transport regulator 7 isoform X2 [Canis lupus dingo]XP_038309203.1 FXYD domain-containing ion transport regulator 7 isoform X2 [Canis lupus familiaris]XP_038385285.1 FXYD domain-containing ion transport regulator 7 isoform X2 [Canis lupus familiaris]XP_038513398.1 FXYD domain-containing ion transport regulator 7 isoform X2 [Canis lupus familiaris]